MTSGRVRPTVGTGPSRPGSEPGKAASAKLRCEGTEKSAPSQGERRRPRLDAAHLYSYADIGSHLDRGGLMVRKDIHRLFDTGDLAINPEGLTIRRPQSTGWIPALQPTPRPSLGDHPTWEPGRKDPRALGATSAGLRTSRRREPWSLLWRFIAGLVQLLASSHTNGRLVHQG